MSRIGLKPINIPEGVEVKLDGNTITVKGPKGELTRELHQDILVEINENTIDIKRHNDLKEQRSLLGTVRSLIGNMVEGVVNGFEKNLEINGVGYRAQKQGTKVIIGAGYSHPVEIEE